jgi:cytochrome P450
MFWLIFLLLAVAYCAKLFIYGNDDYWPKRNVPFVKGSDIGPFFKRLLIRIPFHTMTNNIYFHLKAKGKDIKFGGIMEFRRPVAFLMDLDLIKNVMVKDFDHFINRRPFGPKDDPTLMGRILFSMESQEWKDTRSAMSPTFTTGKIRKMFQIFNASSDRMVQFLKNEIGASKELDVRDASSRLYVLFNTIY